MPVYLPIVSEFKDKGIKDAVREFQSLEGVGAKASFAIKKAALPAAAALGGLALAGVDAAKAAAEDAAAAEKLAGTLRNTTGATDDQIQAVEAFISKTSVASAVADDELRPALQNLLVGTKDATKAQDLLGLALDISAGTGKDLDTVTQALSKAYNGQTGALKKLDPSLAKVLEDGASTDEVFSSLADTFGGQSAAAANTAEGKFKSLQIQLGEAKETIGAALLPVITTLTEKMTALAGWVQENKTLVLVLGGIIGGFAAAIVIANAAMTAWAAIQGAVSAATAVWNAILAANPIVLIVIAIAAVVAALIVLQKKFDIFGKAFSALKGVFSAVWDALKVGLDFAWGLIKKYVGLWVGVFQGLVGVFEKIRDGIIGAFKFAVNMVAKLWNSTVGKLSFRLPDWVPGLGGKGFDVPDIPLLAAGGVVTSPTLAMIGEAGPEAVIPLSRLGATGGGPTYVINVNGALDPVSVAAQIRRLLNDDARRAGRPQVL